MHTFGYRFGLQQIKHIAIRGDCEIVPQHRDLRLAYSRLLGLLPSYLLHLQHWHSHFLQARTTMNKPCPANEVETIHPFGRPEHHVITDACRVSDKARVYLITATEIATNQVALLRYDTACRLREQLALIQRLKRRILEQKTVVSSHQNAMAI